MLGGPRGWVKETNAMRYESLGTGQIMSLKDWNSTKRNELVSRALLATKERQITQALQSWVPRGLKSEVTASFVADSPSETEPTKSQQPHDFASRLANEWLAPSPQLETCNQPGICPKKSNPHNRARDVSWAKINCLLVRSMVKMVQIV